MDQESAETELLRAVQLRRDAQRTKRDVVTERVLAVTGVIVSGALLIGAVRMLLAHV